MPHDDTSEARLREAATQAIETADLEFEVADDGAHTLLRVHVSLDSWRALQRATLSAGTKIEEREAYVAAPGEDPFRREGTR